MQGAVSQYDRHEIYAGESEEWSEGHGAFKVVSVVPHFICESMSFTKLHFLKCPVWLW